MTARAPSSRAKRSGAPRPGAPLQSHTIRTGLRAVQWIGALTGLIGVLIFVGIGVGRWILAYTNYGPAVVWRWSTPWFTTGLALTPLAGLGLLSLWRSRGTAVLVYPSGLQYRRGGRSMNLPWQEIVSIHTQGPWTGLRLLGVARPLSLVLEMDDGRSVRFNQELSNFKSLVDTVKQRVYPPMLRAYTQRFNQGGSLQFGPITLDSDGVRVDERRIVWEDLYGASLDRGELTVIPTARSNLKPVKVSAPRIPNIDLCVQMIQSVSTE